MCCELHQRIEIHFQYHQAAVKVDKTSEDERLTISLGKNIPGRLSKVNVGGWYSHYLQCKKDDDDQGGGKGRSTEAAAAISGVVPSASQRPDRSDVMCWSREAFRGQ